MAMAREAIALARTTGDEQVMYSVLRSAISALMDFAPAGERLELNEEFGALAEKRGDIPGQFRSKLRLMIDACEVADRARMDQAIEGCHRLAERIGLPHYRWRAASARAMQATIDGNFSRACRLLDKAQAYADQIDDSEARITLPLQRLFILMEWDSDEAESLENIEASLRRAYDSGMAEAEFYIAPFIDSHTKPADPASARKLLGNKAIVERTFAGGDRYSLCRLGELAAIAGDLDVAERVLELNLPCAGECATLGLMGSCCTGPVAWMLGQTLAALGRCDEALEYLVRALAIAEAMHAPPWNARIHASIADVAATAGKGEIARKHARQAEQLIAALSLRPARAATPGSADTEPAAASDMRGLTMSREGDLWTISCNGDSLMLQNTRGLEMLAKLVARPDTDIHVLDLAGTGRAKDQAGTGPALDAAARRSYEARIRDLEEELEEATEFGDTGRAESLRGEIDFIARELSRAFGLGGRARRPGDAAERARVNVRRRLMDAIERISKARPDAGRYLKNTIKTGMYCRYTPM
jgi:tetratricopeptide (TPR) repeat protein